MNSTKTICESCGLPIEAGPYCQYCIDQEGNLQAFEERLERMSQWIRRTRSEDVSPADAEKQATVHRYVEMIGLTGFASSFPKRSGKPMNGSSVVDWFRTKRRS